MGKMDPANPATNKQIALRVVLLFVLVILSSYLFFYYDLHVFFKDKNRIIDFIKSSPYDEIVFILLQITQVVAAPIPGELTGFIGGYIYGIVLGALYSTIGLTLGSWLAFGLARMFGLPFVEKFVSPKVIARYDRIMAHQGPFVAFLLFLIPGFPKDALCYILGLSHIKTKTFLIIATVGRLLGTIILSIQGSCVRNQQNGTFLIITAVSIVFFGLAYYLGQKWFEKYHKPHPAVKKDAGAGPGQT